MEGPLIRSAAALLLASLAACAWTRSGWASRGSYRVLLESPTVQIRRGGQKLDPRTGELMISWVGARAPDGQPAILACELTIFDDRDGDEHPDAPEVLLRRESHEAAEKILFADVRLRRGQPGPYRARIVASTDRERCVATWKLAPD